MRPALAALVRLRPKVKPAWAPARPKQPRSAMGRRFLRFSRLPGSGSLRTRRSPPAVKRSATIGSGGRKSAAYLVAAKLPPQKRAASISETSVSAACLLIPFSPAVQDGGILRPRRKPRHKARVLPPFGEESSSEPTRSTQPIGAFLDLALLSVAGRAPYGPVA